VHGLDHVDHSGRTVRAAERLQEPQRQAALREKRARQINAYYHSLSEGAYGEYTPPMVEVPSGNYLTIALEETAQGKLKYEYKA